MARLGTYLLLAGALGGLLSLWLRRGLTDLRMDLACGHRPRWCPGWLARLLDRTGYGQWT